MFMRSVVVHSGVLDDLVAALQTGVCDEAAALRLYALGSEAVKLALLAAARRIAEQAARIAVSYHLNPATDYHVKVGHFEEAAVRRIGLPAIRLEDLHRESPQDGGASVNHCVGPVGLVVSSHRRGT
ncbi:MAG: hypothetical protein IPM64_00205 [Phycisphaerales bacterium]|nr:hypothetical protein [Phycisphaerales bacterium]